MHIFGFKHHKDELKRTLQVFKNYTKIENRQKDWWKKLLNFSRKGERDKSTQILRVPRKDK